MPLIMMTVFSILQFRYWILNQSRQGSDRILKTNDWFAVFPFKKTDILISHDSIEDYSCTGINSSSPEIPQFCIDRIFTETDSDSGSIKQNLILIRQKKTFFITSSSSPEIQHEDIKKFHFPPKLLRKFFKQKGITALSFDDNKMKILIDPEKFAEEALQ